MFINLRNYFNLFSVYVCMYVSFKIFKKEDGTENGEFNQHFKLLNSMQLLLLILILSLPLPLLLLLSQLLLCYTCFVKNGS
jgi:hypothetical protein